MAIAPDDGEWFAPIALTAEQPVSQFEIDGALTLLFFLEPFDNLRLGLGRGQSADCLLYTSPSPRD